MPCPGGLERQSLPDFLISQMKKHGSKVAQVDAVTGEAIAFDSLLHRAAALADWLGARGMRPGRVAVIMGENSTHFGWALLGVLQTGGTVQLLSPRSTKREVEHAVSLSRPFAALISDAVAADSEVTSALSMPCVLVWGREGQGQELGGPEGMSLLRPLRHRAGPPGDVPEQLLEGSPVALLLSSSGTTGLPKAVMLTHDNVLATIRIGHHFVTPGDVVTGLPPFFHSFGCMLMLMAMHMGNLMVVMRFSSLAGVLEAMRVHQVNSLHLVPPLLGSLAQHPGFTTAALPCLRRVQTGATTVSPLVQAEVRRRFPTLSLLHGYGMSETCFGIMCAEVRPDKPASSGLPLGDMECKIIDPNTGNIVPQGQMGEICVRGPMVMKGYLSNPEANSGTIDKAGWVHSGDLAYVDQDGYYFIVERLKSIFKYNGNQVSPTELEMLITSHPGVREAAVIGVPHLYGHSPMALVVRGEDAVVTESELQAFVAERVERHKRLQGGVRFIDALPKTASGKLQRSHLAAIAPGSAPT